MNFRSSSFMRWLQTNLLSSPLNIGLTLIMMFFLWQAIPPVISWTILDATLSGNEVASCKTIDSNGNVVDAPGACWVFIKVRLPQFLFGLWYTQNSDQIWRPVLAFILLISLLVALAADFLPVKFKRRLGLSSLVVFPLIAFALLNGSWLGLPEARTSDWGGLTLTLVLATVGIVAALPIGIVLALARQSKMKIVKSLAVLWIELFRGTPLITILFFASVMLPLFFPVEVEFDKVVRAMIGITIFQSAYTAEAIRGGLIAVPRGQFEAASALGMGYWRSNAFIILPQALKVSIPSIVNSFIELYKDTSLVLIIGLLDLLNIVTIASRSVQWKGYETEGYLFAALLYFLFCYAMSRYSQKLEAKLDTNIAGDKLAQN